MRPLEILWLFPICNNTTPCRKMRVKYQSKRRPAHMSATSAWNFDRWTPLHWVSKWIVQNHVHTSTFLLESDSCNHPLSICIFSEKTRMATFYLEFLARLLPIKSYSKIWLGLLMEDILDSVNFEDFLFIGLCGTKAE